MDLVAIVHPKLIDQYMEFLGSNDINIIETPIQLLGGICWFIDKRYNQAQSHNVSFPCLFHIFTM